MDFTEINNREFIYALASKAPVPGGGGASAYVAAIGMALGNMVGSLTVGKKKYADVQEEIMNLKKKSDRLQAELLHLINEDAKSFEPLAAAYGLPTGTEEEKIYKEEMLEKTSKGACDVPIKIMEKCCEAIDIIEIFAKKGSVIAVSDAGAGAVICGSALKAASLNVFINTKSLKDREFAEEMNKKANDMIEKYSDISENIFSTVKEKLDS